MTMRMPGGRRWQVAAAPLVMTGLLAGCGTSGPTAGPAGPGAASPTGAGSALVVPGTVSPTGIGSPAAAPSAELARTAQAGVTVSATLRPGARGPQVLALQRRLTQLGYWLGSPDGRYGDLTRQAVVALQKAAGISRDGVTGPKTRAALSRGVRPKAYTRRGHVIEVDLRHQLLLIVDNGRVTRILNTSTGSGVWYTAPDGHRAHATTPVGSFRVSWQVNGWKRSPLGLLYKPKYFHPRGIAVHGYSSVPAHPASHGCVRVSMAAMNMLWGKGVMPVGTRVVVH